MASIQVPAIATGVPRQALERVLGDTFARNAGPHDLVGVSGTVVAVDPGTDVLAVGPGRTGRMGRLSGPTMSMERSTTPWPSVASSPR